MNLTSLYLPKQFSEPSVCLLQAYSAHQPSSNLEAGVFQVQQKSLAYVVGERVLGPLINRVSIWGSGLMSVAQKGISAAHFVFNKLTPSLPVVSAAHVYPPTENPLVKTIQDHLEQGKDINEEVNEMGTLLQKAASVGDPEAIQFLIDHEADVNKRSQTIGTTVAKNDRTALMLAAMNGHGLAVYTLLKANPNLELQDNEGHTAFKLAVRTEDPDCINLIIEKTLEINPQHKFQWPIKLSTHTIDKPDDKFKKAILRKVKRRIKNSIDLEQPISFSNKKSTPLQVASRLGYLEAMELLIEHHANINAQQKEFSGFFESTAKALLNTVGLDADTPLIQASKSGYASAVQLLLMAKADLNLQNLEGSTALMISIEKRHKKVTELLINAGANLDLQNNARHTALMMAVLYNLPEIVELLVKAGANLSLKNSWQRTPLMQTQYVGLFKIYNLLSKEESIRSNRQAINKPGADFEQLVETLVEKRIQESINHGQSLHLDQPIFLAKFHFLKLSSELGYSNTLEINKFNLLQLSSKFCYLKAMELLIERNANINAQKKYDAGFWGYVQWLFVPEDFSTKTSLIAASESGCSSAVKILLKAGADLNLQDKYGYTALMSASGKGHKEVVDLLIKARANLDLQSNWGGTALFIAIDHYEAEIAELLLKGGANPNPDVCKFFSCKSPLWLASRKGERKIVELLIEAGAYLDPSDQLLRETDLPALVDQLLKRSEEEWVEDNRPEYCNPDL